MLEGFLRKIYDGFDTSKEIEPSAWREVLRIINSGAVQGFTESNYPPTHDESFLKSIRHSNEVFSAFKVHAMATKMAERLIGEDGKLRSYEEWRKAVAPIASHHVGSWLRTEYDTAVIRAHQAADWREFEHNKDIFPNLEWMPTTSPSPEVGHAAFWGKPVILPVDDPFWKEHRPGDRWNCKCSLEPTDTTVQRLDDEELAEAAKPEHRAQRGLEGDPARKGLITDKHPYYPESCAKCPFYASKGVKGWVRRHFSNRTKDCHSCPYVDKAVIKAKLEEQYPTDKWEHSYIDASGGYVVTEHERIAESQVSKQELGVYRKEQDMARDLAKQGHKIVHLAEHNRPAGDRYDTLFDGVKADFKSTKSNNNITKYGKKAFREQGADMVVYRLEEHAYGMLDELKKLKVLFPDKRIVYYYQDEQVLREL
nr:phage minor head protein [uncultured Porphyromonas sp.]